MKKLDQKEIDEIIEKKINELSEIVNRCMSNTSNENIDNILKVYSEEIKTAFKDEELLNFSRNDVKKLTVGLINAVIGNYADIISNMSKKTK